MSLTPPNLDDRDFEQLLEEAKERLRRTCPEWTDLSPHDPGIVLLELFAHLMEVMIYRLNRVPEKAYIEFLRLIGAQLQPPAAAVASLRFAVSRPAETALEIPAGTRVTVARASGEPPVFETARNARIEAGKKVAHVIAYHAERISGELAGKGTGMPGLSVRASRPPLVAPTSDDLELFVGVEAKPDELSDRVRAVEYQGKAYRIWNEVENFTNLSDDRHVYIVDRMIGKITFAPAIQGKSAGGGLEQEEIALAEVPAAEREIRLWYHRGGGLEGNVAAATLTTIKDSIARVEVSNPKPSSGGKAPETLENALLRGPQEFHSLHRAVTARDFELLASRAGGVSRARAFTKASLWAHATAGTVEVLLVPDLPDEARQGTQVSVEDLKKHQAPQIVEQIDRTLEERRTLGTTCLVNWVSYKTVQVRARIVVHRGEDPELVRNRVVARLHRTITPLPTSLHSTGWRFGQPLRVSNVYDIVLAEPGVSYADRVRLKVEDVPNQAVSAMEADAFQPRTFFAATGAKLFRSVNNGEGWELAAEFAGGKIARIRVHQERPGLVVVATTIRGGAQLHVSEDCGETWSSPAQTAFQIQDIDWMSREGTPVLLLATDVGLYEIPLDGRESTDPVQILVDPKNQDLGFYAIAVSREVRGGISVALAARGTEGVFLSTQGGQSNSFTKVGLEGEAVRILKPQYIGPRVFLWAGIFASGSEAGKGCFRWEIGSPQGWEQMNRGWQGGSCRSLSFHAGQAVAGTHRAGVLRLQREERDKPAAWAAPDVDCGLPIRDVGRFFPVDSVAVDPRSSVLLAAGERGVFRSQDGGLSYQESSREEFDDSVTIPPSWLFCSGDHEIEVVSEDEAPSD